MNNKFSRQYSVTIGIPVFKAADYIGKTMESALAQSYPNIEFLVVDDCGDDGSIEVVEKLAKEHIRGCDIRILRNETHLGPGSTRNRIIDEALGNYLYFLDSDDLIEPYTIQLLMDEMQRTQSEAVYASYEIVDKVNHTPNQVYQKPSQHFRAIDELADFAFRCSNVFQVTACNCLIDINFLRKIGLRFFDATYWEDMAFTYELVTHISHAVTLPNITYHYLQRPGSLSHYQDRELLQKAEILKNYSIIDYLKSMCGRLKGKPYLPYLCYNLEMNSFYVICHVLKHSNRITPSFSHSELHQFLKFPLPLRDILRPGKRFTANLTLWMVAHLPLFLFVPVVRILGKAKNVL